MITRESAILCGIPYVDATFAQLDPRVRIHWKIAEGAQVEANQTLFEIQGPARSLLTGERTALNFLQLLSGTATAAHAFTERLKGTRCRLLDTRKTIPGLRSAQKYAVRVGGGHNHRMGLFDGILIKENHIMAAGSIARAVGRGEVSGDQGARWRSRWRASMSSSRRSPPAPTSRCSMTSRSRTCRRPWPSIAVPRVP